MDQLGENIADRYQLQLGANWEAWFDHAIQELAFPGAFQSPLSAELLVSRTPPAIWPGFMLPDTLPIVGNQYGDWICVRITADGGLGELIHWYHGGGDWIPIGESMQEALLHDVVDQYRPLRQQMLRGAFETLAPDHLREVSSRIEGSHFQTWLTQGLGGDSSRVASRLTQVIDLLQRGDYTQALLILFQESWAVEATACDLVEDALQTPVARVLAAVSSRPPAQFADELAAARWSFDSSMFPAPASLGVTAADSPLQDWELAESTCRAILQRRQDLGWTFDILGWCQQRAGRIAEASEVYYAGRFASSFSNQSVRLRTHWFDQRYGKFSVAKLVDLASDLSAAQSDDAYIAVIRKSTPEQLLGRVQRHWQQRGHEQLAAGNAPEAYESFYRAGWDLGAPRLSDYREILTQIAVAAAAAGWTAREITARTHLACLEQRLKR